MESKPLGGPIPYARLQPVEALSFFESLCSEVKTAAEDLAKNGKISGANLWGFAVTENPPPDELEFFWAKTPTNTTSDRALNALAFSTNAKILADKLAEDGVSNTERKELAMAISVHFL